MAIVTRQLRLFGLDLTAFAQSIELASLELVSNRPFNWLRPRTPCALWVQAGSPPLWAGSLGAPAKPNASATRLKHFAVLIPEKLLLRQSLQLPRMPASELLDALTLHAQNASPFLPADLIWSHRPVGSDMNGETFQIILSSRHLLEQYVSDQYPQLTKGTWEAWCLTDAADMAEDTYFVLPGFAENKRQKIDRRRAVLTALLVVLASILAAAAAVTPTLQLRERVLLAGQAMENLRAEAGPALAQREAYMRLTDKHRLLLTKVGHPVSSLRVLDMLTRSLPDDTSLQTLQLQGQTVQITGYTPNTASLMKSLGVVEGVKAVRAPAPATKPPGTVRETFNLEVEIDPLALLITKP